MKSVTIATCIEQQQLQESDAVFAETLAARECEVLAAPWNGDQAAFENADAVIIRSTWDYQNSPQAFVAWFEALALKIPVFNSAQLIRRNMSKRYLLDLQTAGVAMPPLSLVVPTADSIAAGMDTLGLQVAVVKPEFGATSSGLSIVKRTDEAGLAKAAEKMAMPGLVQALAAEIESIGETSFMFIDGVYTHAMTKKPKAGDIRCQAEFGGTVELASPPAHAIDDAARILAMMDETPLYARIDGILLDEGLQLMEVELIEPELFFTYCPEAAARLAAALIERL
ncbi:hypothetical protein PUV54_05135 [Hyphococcus flavus]|uniref:Prokaryotic glutathione synthetase ATP-binding domain-containing protein n=1 Tax=Hyphococcus flavus TaxID=1866326 RepID=A0AAF0CI73_9PROT|nr:hypothetical protein [Hyphococcus flavus]WDI32577.1 hypothetical protein PUV54_05135 [Hyphococcus flavus]